MSQVDVWTQVPGSENREWERSGRKRHSPSLVRLWPRECLWLSRSSHPGAYLGLESPGVTHEETKPGDRQANSALWRIAMVRIAHDPETTAYFDRRAKEGRTFSSASRSSRTSARRRSRRERAASMMSLAVVRQAGALLVSYAQ